MMRGRVDVTEARPGSGLIRRDQVIRCSCEGCSVEFRKPCQKGSPYPTVALAKFARHRGWKVDANRPRAYCPAHAH